MLSVVRVGSFDEAVRVNNGVRYGLSSSVYTGDVNLAFRALQELDNGITYVNAPTIGAEAHLPFGGVKATGNGHREGGWEVYEFYSETKVGLRGLLRQAPAGADRHLRRVVDRARSVRDDLRGEAARRAGCARLSRRVRFVRFNLQLARIASWESRANQFEVESHASNAGRCRQAGPFVR